MYPGIGSRVLLLHLQGRRGGRGNYTLFISRAREPVTRILYKARQLRVSDGINRMIDAAGVSFILFFGKPLIKLIPTRYGEYLPQCGETLNIQIETKK